MMKTLSMAMLVLVLVLGMFLVVVSCDKKESKAKELTLDLGNKVTMKLVIVPAGKFTMGSSKEEQTVAKVDAEKALVTGFDASDEGPQHEVTISKPFYIGVYEVTQEQYKQIMGRNPSNFDGSRNPVEMVSWNDAMDFCNKLSQKTGKTVRLPTEAEWEYACRAGSTTRFHFGDDGNYAELGDFAWYAKNPLYTGGTHPVGQKKPNAWGLYDMHGNVCEWCADWFGEYSSSAVTDPTRPASGRSRVLRGGEWFFIPQLCRSADREGTGPTACGETIGFRAVIVVAGEN